MTTYNLNSKTISADAYVPFNATTGEGSNIDAIITNCGVDNIIYAVGVLSVRSDGAMRVVNEGDFACFHEIDDESLVLTAVDLDAQFAEE